MENFKCHSKLCLITLRDKKGTHYITQVGTGNYNEKTSALYTDLSVMTASPVIGDDGAAFFRNMLTDNLEGGYHSLLVAPNGLKSQLCAMIQQEIDKGPQGYLCIKANSITEREIIDKLREASRGVQIEMIIRGICCIRPGVLLKTENIQVTSIVGRYLEHARIYVFGRGDQAKYFIASADLMTRNLQRRVEIACPIWDREIQEQLRYILDLQLQDNAKASFLQPSGRLPAEGDPDRPGGQSGGADAGLPPSAGAGSHSQREALRPPPAVGTSVRQRFPLSPTAFGKTAPVPSGRGPFP